MILIADSGSTKTSWYISDEQGNSKMFHSNGINPFFRDTSDIYNELTKVFSELEKASICNIYFYGAGIINPEKGQIVSAALQGIFPKADIETQSDLLAAARATLGNNEGIACILGTGSNSCFYDGHKILKNVPPLGYILGDEGSGAVLGKKLVADYLKGLLPHKLSAKFKAQYNISYSDFLNRIYKKEKPNQFLAQFAPFLKENISDKYCENLVKTSFQEFVNKNIIQYKKAKNIPICFVGSLAYFFKNQLTEVLNSNHLQTGTIEKEPLPGLIQFHLNN